MPKKGGKGKGKKGKKGPVDWAEQNLEKFVELEVRNSVWASMRFTVRMSTKSKIVRRKLEFGSPGSCDHSLTSLSSPPRGVALLQDSIVKLIMDRHRIAGLHGLNLYLGEAVDEAALLRPEEYWLSLKEIKVDGGSLNDHVVQVVTYDYAPHRTAESDMMPPSRNYGILHLPRSLLLPPLRQVGPC